jgi:uncharacterized protein (DUF305 family)
MNKKRGLSAAGAVIFVLAICAANASAQNQVVTSVKVTDIQFLDMMMRHHSDGVKMARMGVDKAQDAGVKALAEKMAAGQQKDIEEMQAIRDARFSINPKAEIMTVKGRKMTSQMMMKTAEQDMKKLEAASGAEFDRVFLDVFMKHHRMALDMSKEETSKGRDTEAKKKAGEIISVQTKEIAEMKRLKTKVASAKK